MRVLHISRGLCPRITKLAYVQQKRGMHTYWGGLTNPSFQRTFPFRQMFIGDDMRFGGVSQIIRKQAGKVDLFHVHTHIMDTAILDDVIRLAKKPVIWDCHDDPIYYKSDAPKLTPTECFEGTVYRTYCPKDWFQAPQVPQYTAIIATGLSDVPGHFRYWLPVFKAFHDLGIRVKCYTPSVITNEYREIAEMREAIDLRYLLEEMSWSAFGICGAPVPSKNIDEAYPNKLFEYVAAGIPVLCFGKNLAMSQVIETHELGVCIDSVDDIPMAMERIQNENMRKNVLLNRHRFTMDSQEPIVRQFYEGVIFDKLRKHAPETIIQ